MCIKKSHLTIEAAHMSFAIVSHGELLACVAWYHAISVFRGIESDIRLHFEMVPIRNEVITTALVGGS